MSNGKSNVTEGEVKSTRPGQNKKKEGVYCTFVSSPIGRCLKRRRSFLFSFTGRSLSWKRTLTSLRPGTCLPPVVGPPRPQPRWVPETGLVCHPDRVLVTVYFFLSFSPPPHISTCPFDRLVVTLIRSKT